MHSPFIRFLMLILSLFSLSLLSPAALSITIDKMVVLGDSLSDNGNIFEVTSCRIPRNPPYFAGHFSNGPIWVERVANKLKFNTKSKAELDDHAYAKAWGSDLNEVDHESFFTLKGEIVEYMDQEHAPVTADNNHLYSIWIGSNDYLAGDKNLSIDAATNLTVNAIIDGMETLIKNRNARYFLVLNLTDLGQTPSAVAEGAEKVQRVSALAYMHNKKLADKLKELRVAHPGILIMEMDLMSYFQEIVRTPKKFNIKYVDKACYDGDFGNLKEKEGCGEKKPVHSKAQLTAAYYTAELVPRSSWHVCKHPYDYVYWDTLHPTQHVHQLLADLVLKTLHENDVHRSA